MPSRKQPVVRVSLRSLAHRSTFLAVVHRVTERDIQIFFDLYQHRVLTTHQIKELHFNSQRVATRRLTTLSELGFIERFQPHRATGSHPYHHVLAEAGAFVVASRVDRDFKEFGWKQSDIERIALSQKLPHITESNDFFTSLAWAYRRSGRGELSEWLSGYHPSFSWTVIPDGIGLVHEGNRKVHFAYEHDRGTESHQQLEEKIDNYQRLSLARTERENAKDALVILFTFPSERREAEARKVLFGSGFSVATGVYRRVMADPLGRVWLPLLEKIRMRLIDLPYVVPLRVAMLPETDHVP